MLSDSLPETVAHGGEFYDGCRGQVLAVQREQGRGSGLDAVDQAGLGETGQDARHPGLGHARVGTGKADDHRAAVPELANAGPTGKALKSPFRRLLGLKTAARYQAAPISRTDATKAVEWAARMVAGARDVAGR